MNKIPKERGPDPFVQAYTRSPGVFMNFLKNFGSQTKHIKCGREMGSYVLMWNILGEQVSMMETWKNP